MSDYDWRTAEVVPYGVKPENGIRIHFSVDADGAEVIATWGHGYKSRKDILEWLELTKADVRMINIEFTVWQYLVFFDDVTFKLFKMTFGIT